jgi:hypothetical protein
MTVRGDSEMSLATKDTETHEEELYRRNGGTEDNGAASVRWSARDARRQAALRRPIERPEIFVPLVSFVATVSVLRSSPFLRSSCKNRSLRNLRAFREPS